MARTLITAAEVIAYSSAGANYPTKDICIVLPVLEAEFGRTCLGDDLYTWLLENATDYPASASEWSSTTTYADGAYSVRNGCLFESLINSNLNNDPITDDGTKWGTFNKFGTNDCANEFWEDHLRRVLALKIYAESIIFSTIQSGGNGLTVMAGAGAYQGQGVETVSKAQMTDYQKGLLALAESATANMIKWANDKVKNDATCNVPLSGMIDCNGICLTPQMSRRRWALKY